jgi:hypothetical protein
MGGLLVHGFAEYHKMARIPRLLHHLRQPAGTLLTLRSGVQALPRLAGEDRGSMFSQGEGLAGWSVASRKGGGE